MLLKLNAHGDHHDKQSRPVLARNVATNPAPVEVEGGGLEGAALS